jgi:hypothetical protein
MAGDPFVPLGLHAGRKTIVKNWPLKPAQNWKQKLYTAWGQNACILLLTAMPRQTTISVALNKKSAQKQKAKQ